MRDTTSPAVSTDSSVRPDVPIARLPDRAFSAWPDRAARCQRYVVLRRLLALSDVGAILFVSILLALTTWHNSADFAWALAFLPVWLVAAKLLGLYERDEAVLRHLTVDEIPQIVLWAVIGTVGLSLFLRFSPADEISASSAVALGAIVAAAAVILRASVRGIWRHAISPQPIVLLGPSDCLQPFKRKLELFPDLHMKVFAEEQLPIRESAPGWLSDVERLVVAPRTLEGEEVEHVFEFAREYGLLLTIVPPRDGAFGHGLRLSSIAELPILDHGKVDLARSTLFLKRVLDLVVASLALIVLAPVLAVIALSVKLDHGSVFFSQWRAGQGGRPFKIRKFRTMVDNAEDLLPQLVRFDDLPEPVFKLEHDPRVTRVGRVLRRWSLDELPQLWNVLTGEMSLVGPRPEELALVERYSPEHRLRLHVKPGMTGPMQVQGRAALSLEERVAVERDYIENLSLGWDLRILGLTLAAVVRGSGAH